LEEAPFVSISESIGVIQTPLYTAIIQEGTISTETKAKIAEEITRIHTTVMKVPKNLDRIPRLASEHGQ
jgi:hypothetical protein